MSVIDTPTPPPGRPKAACAPSGGSEPREAGSVGATFPAGNDFLALEPLLVARLKAALADLRPAVHVLTAAQLADVDEAKQLAPAVHVIHAGFRVRETRADGRAAQLDHTWLIVAAVKASRELRSGAAARELAGQLAARAGAALMGWKVPGLTREPLILTSAPGARHAAGYLYLPLAFTAVTVFSATPFQPS